MGRFYTLEGMHSDFLDVVYACVCGVMSVSVRGSVVYVGDEGGVHVYNHNFGLTGPFYCIPSNKTF